MTTKSIVVEYLLPGPPAKVWRALTEPELLGSWLMANDIVPEVGRAFTFRSKPMGDWDGTVHCEVLAVEPLRLLKYTWKGGGKSGLDSTVTWTLSPGENGGTKLRLDHDGFTDANGFAFDAMGKGWRDKQAKLAELSL